VTTLLGARVCIRGFGSIAQDPAPVLRPLGAQVRGAARRAGERAGVEVVAEDDLEAELARTDVLVMVLPATAATPRALDARRLAARPAHAYVVDVGRGHRRRAGARRGAPRGRHAAGGRPVGADELVSADLAALLAGRDLRDVVAR
jgi:phosphoglycerate dehydrogenase-like enzyme